MSGRSLLVFVAVLSFVTGCMHRGAGGAAATPPDAPAASAGDYAGALNLPAMVLTPADLDAAGFPGYGTLGDGAFVPFADFVANQAETRGLPEAEVTAASTAAGWRRFYGSALGLPSVPGDPESCATQVAWSFVNEYADAAGAAAALADLGVRGDDPGVRRNAFAGTAVLGEESRIAATVGGDSACGPGTGRSLLFRRGTLIGGAGFEGVGDAPNLDSTTAAAVESLAARLLAKMEVTLAADDPGLSVPALRMDRTTVPVVYERESYRIRNGETLPVYGGFKDDILALPAVFATVEEVYEVEQLLEIGEEPVDTNPHYVLRLMRFKDEAAASAFLAAYPTALATGTGAVMGASPIAGAAVDLGDESRAIAFRAGGAGSRPAAYEIDVRVGTTVAAVYLGSTLRPDLAVVEELAAAQVACLEAGACAPVSVPEALLATPFAFPEGSPAAAEGADVR